MKKISFIALLAILAVTGKLSAQSESYTPWQVDFAVGWANPSGEGTKGGASAYAEPKFHINDHITVGVRMSVALMGKAKLDAAGKAAGDFSATGVDSYLATGNYYFQFSQGGKFRPFAGIGLGYAEAAGIATLPSIEAKSGFGGMARAGFDVGHFCLNAEYALNPKTGGISNNYIGINIGFYLGGGSQE